jgi:hypothetical protein
MRSDIQASLLSVITPATFSTYLLDFYSAFLNIHGKRFAKPYTPTQLIKITSHTLTYEGVVTDDEEYEWTLEPTHVNVKNGVFQLFWRGTAETIKIQLADAGGGEDDKAPAPAPAPTPELEEVEMAVAEDTATNGFLRLTSNSQLRDKRSIEEARIRAKWAQYKAEKAIAKYVERYGELDDELLSDSGSGSDSE